MLPEENFWDWCSSISDAPQAIQLTVSEQWWQKKLTEMSKKTIHHCKKITGWYCVKDQIFVSFCSLKQSWETGHKAVREKQPETRPANDRSRFLLPFSRRSLMNTTVPTGTNPLRGAVIIFAPNCCRYVTSYVTLCLLIRCERFIAWILPELSKRYSL